MAEQIIISEKAKAERVEELFLEAEKKVKNLAAKGFDYFRLDFNVIDRAELSLILDKFEQIHNLSLGYNGLTYNGYSGDFKSYSVRLC